MYSFNFTSKSVWRIWNNVYTCKHNTQFDNQARENVYSICFRKWPYDQTNSKKEKKRNMERKHYYPLLLDRYSLIMTKHKSKANNNKKNNSKRLSRALYACSQLVLGNLMMTERWPTTMKGCFWTFLLLVSFKCMLFHVSYLLTSFF
jgi:hypothetical protein